MLLQMLGQCVAVAKEPPLSRVYPDWRSRVEGDISPKCDNEKLGCEFIVWLVVFGGELATGIVQTRVILLTMACSIF